MFDLIAAKYGFDSISILETDRFKAIVGEKDGSCQFFFKEKKDENDSIDILNYPTTKEMLVSFIGNYTTTTMVGELTND